MLTTQFLLLILALLSRKWTCVFLLPDTCSFKAKLNSHPQSLDPKYVLVVIVSKDIFPLQKNIEKNFLNLRVELQVVMGGNQMAQNSTCYKQAGTRMYRRGAWAGAKGWSGSWNFNSSEPAISRGREEDLHWTHSFLLIMWIQCAWDGD